MPINKTGLADPNNYVLGRGNVSVAELDGNGNPISWRDIGNAPVLSASISIEDLKHVSSRKGIKFVDKRIIVSTEMGLSLSFDEIADYDNLALWMLGETVEPVNAAIAGFAQWLMVPDGNLALARHYHLVDSLGVRAFDVDSADVLIKTNETIPVTLIDGTDYTLNGTLGTFMILSTSALAVTAITAGKGLLVTVTADALASAKINQVKGMTLSTKVVAIRLEQQNPADADRLTEILWPKVTLAPDGDLGFISDDFGVAQMTGTAERADPGSLYEGQSCIITDPLGN